jgi:pyrroloquinoline quinone biosynthesis protein B
VPQRSQPSIAVSADGERWSIVNAAPDVRDQLARTPELHPRPGTRDVPLDTVVITNPDLDHVLGLLVMRESLPYRVVSTPFTRRALLRHNAVFRLVEPAWGEARIDEGFFLDRGEALEARFFPVPGKVPTWCKALESNAADATTGLRITERRTGLQQLDSGTLAELEAADVRFVDGTFWSEEELLAMRPGAPSATAMGHTPVGGPGGSLEKLRKLPGRTIYIHMNNTNPMLASDSPEAAAVRAAGVAIAEDGLEVEL